MRLTNARVRRVADNGVQSEGVENRVLYATSKDAIEWSLPQVKNSFLKRARR